MKNFLTFLVLLSLLGACAGEESSLRDTGLDYYPLQTGMYYIYDVHEIRYSAYAPEAEDYEIMMVVADSFPSAEGHYTYVIHRSRRDPGQAEWQALDTWSVRKNKREVIVTEGNVPFVRMRFPVTSNSPWDGNALNMLGTDTYRFINPGKPLQREDMHFGKTVTIEQERNEDNIVFRDERSETYAMNVGLVYKSVTQWRFCTDDDCLGQQRIEEGVELKMAIKTYGRQ